MTIDTNALKAGTDIVAVIGAYTPLKRVGSELAGPCPIHGGDGNNFYVNPQKGIWSCFSHGCHECEEGNDVIGFLRRVENLTFQQACERLGADTKWRPVAPIRQLAKPPPERVCTKPPPEAGEPKMHMNGLGEPTRHWGYLDTDGAPLMYVARYDHADGKQIRCWTWSARPGESPAWRCGHWQRGERPLYNLDQIAARPDAPVMLVEGEKSAEAAAALLPQYVVSTWPGGANAWKHADFTPLRGRRVDLWPDADEPGIENMRKLGAYLADWQGLACTGKIVDPSDMPAGFDAADWAEGPEELYTWLREHAKPYDGTIPLQAPQQAPENEPHAALPLEAYADEGGRSAAPTPSRSPAKPLTGALGEVEYRPMSEITSRAIDWLWPGRIAKGKVSMIVGNPGLGKSQVCASLASVVSNGGSWPVDRAPCKRGSVVILSAEDDPEDTIRPRLDAAGADVSRIFILDAIRIENNIDQERRGFDLTKDVKRLGSLLDELGDVALVIIDPVTAYLGQADSHKNAEVRALLAPLAEMAANQRCAILAVSHLTKSSGMDALLRVQGSIGFAAAARAVWGVAKDKDNQSRRLFMPLKNNLGTDVSGFAYSVEGIRLQDSDIETSHVMWEDQVVTLSADDVFGQSEQTHDERGAVFEAKQFLRGLLADGPVDSKQIELDARGAGHSMTTVRRAAKELNLRIAKDGFGKGAPWKWFPEQQP